MKAAFHIHVEKMTCRIICRATGESVLKWTPWFANRFTGNLLNKKSRKWVHLAQWLEDKKNSFLHRTSASNIFHARLPTMHYCQLEQNFQVSQGVSHTAFSLSSFLERRLCFANFVCPWRWIYIAMIQSLGTKNNSCCCHQCVSSIWPATFHALDVTQEVLRSLSRCLALGTVIIMVV